MGQAKSDLVFEGRQRVAPWLPNLLHRSQMKSVKHLNGQTEGSPNAMLAMKLIVKHAAH